MRESETQTRKCRFTKSWRRQFGSRRTERAEKSEQAATVFAVERAILPAGAGGLQAVRFDGGFERVGAAVVQVGRTVGDAPERRRAELVGRDGRELLAADEVARPRRQRRLVVGQAARADAMQQQVAVDAFHF